MIGSKKFIKRAKKWQIIDDISEKRNLLPRSLKFSDGESGKKAPVISRGCFVIYTTDEKRFLMPLTFLNNNIFVKLLKLSEEEFGITSDGPIMIPCDSSLMSSLMLAIQQGLGKESEQALFDMVASSCSSTYTSNWKQHRTTVAC